MYDHKPTWLLTINLKDTILGMQAMHEYGMAYAKVAPLFAAQRLAVVNKDWSSPEFRDINDLMDVVKVRMTKVPDSLTVRSKGKYCVTAQVGLKLRFLCDN